MNTDWFRQELERKVREQVQYALGIEPAVPVFVDAPPQGPSLTIQTLLECKALLSEPGPSIILEPLRLMPELPELQIEVPAARVHAFGIWTDPMRPSPFLHIPAVSERDLEEVAEVGLALDHLQQQGTKFYTRAGKRKLDRTMGFVGRRRD